MTINRRTKVLVVDDSALIRKMLVGILSQDPQIEVVGTASDPYVARDEILAKNPDVLTLDIEMPRMDGLKFLGILQKHRPIPVIVISTLTHAGSETALAALEAGAMDVLGKPTRAEDVPAFGEALRRRVKGAMAEHFRPVAPRPKAVGAVQRLQSQGTYHTHQIILIGASTGGTEALKEVLPLLPDGLPGICVVQHIPPVFSKAFAERIDKLCAYEVREAQTGDEIRPGLALVAPGDYHMVLTLQGGRYRVSLQQTPPVQHVRPSVDVLFASVAQCVGARVTAVLLTGMGADGAAGMQKLKAIGARTIAQNQETCVVYGMPRAAVELGVVDQVLPLERIPQAILYSVNTQAQSASIRAQT